MCSKGCESRRRERLEVVVRITQSPVMDGGGEVSGEAIHLLAGIQGVLVDWKCT